MMRMIQSAKQKRIKGHWKRMKNMKKNYDAIIIGGGVNGCSIAFQLGKRGYKTAIIEKNTIGAESSGAAAGMLGAQAEFGTNDVYFQYACKSRELFPELMNELEEVTRMSTGICEEQRVGKVSK